MAVTFRIAPCLWFAEQADEAARFYVGLFPNSRIVRTTRYGQTGYEIHHRKPGSVMTVDFELDGHRFTALNGGPLFTFSEAVSFQVYCETQAEIDHYWDRLSEGGDPKAQQCGWLKDRFGLSWQVVPLEMERMLDTADAAALDRTMAAVLRMKKLDIDTLRRAYGGA